MIRRWVYHCYLKSYPSYAWGTTDGEEETRHISELHTNISMYAPADKYDMADLKQQALQKLNYFLNKEDGEEAGLDTMIEIIPLVCPTTHRAVKVFESALWVLQSRIGHRSSQYLVYRSSYPQALLSMLQMNSLRRLSGTRIVAGSSGRTQGQMQFLNRGSCTFSGSGLMASISLQRSRKVPDS